jgi:hypothetical protein
VVGNRRPRLSRVTQKYPGLNVHTAFSIFREGTCASSICGTQAAPIHRYHCRHLNIPRTTVGPNTGSTNRCALIQILDAVGSIGFNAIKPWLLSVAGSRNFDGDETESDDSGDDTEDEGTKVVTFKRRLKSNPVDASVRLWDFASLEGGP